MFTITWNPGQTSTVTANTTATLVGGLLVVTHTGTVTAGLFHGDTVVRTATGPATNILLCLAGLATVSAVTLVGDLAITSIGGN